LDINRIYKYLDKYTKENVAEIDEDEIVEFVDMISGGCASEE